MPFIVCQKGNTMKVFQPNGWLRTIRVFKGELYTEVGTGASRDKQVENLRAKGWTVSVREE